MKFQKIIINTLPKQLVEKYFIEFSPLFVHWILYNLTTHTCLWICTHQVSRRGNIFGSIHLSVCLSVCLGVLRVHYTPLQRNMGYLCTRKAQYAPLRHNMHHGAQGRLMFFENFRGPWWFKMTVGMYAWESGWEPHWQGASI